jgi:acetate kinase
MIIVIEPTLREVKFWGFTKDKTGKILSTCLVKEIDEVRDISGLESAVDNILNLEKLDAIAFHIFFGADLFDRSVFVDRAFFDKFRKLVKFFPFYIPLTEDLLRSVYEKYNTVPILAFFETAFFADLPEEEKYYAIPYEYFQNTNIKRWGYHGIYHEFNAQIPESDLRIISIVLDKQTTVCPIYKNRPLAINLGYTPLEGIMSRTSCGDIDPGIVFYLMKQYNYSMFQIDEILKRDSGFYGITGYDLSLEEFFKLYGRGEKINLAFDIYENQILKYIGEGISVLGGVDTLVFSGSLLEYAQPLILNLLEKITFLGVNLQGLPWVNKIGVSCITSPDSKIKVYLNQEQLARIIYDETMKSL